MSAAHFQTVALISTALALWSAGVLARTSDEAVSQPNQGAAPYAESDPAHRREERNRPLAWPGGVIPYDLSQLSDSQRVQALSAMKLWQDTGAALHFIPRTDETAYVFFTGRTDAGNNTSQVGYRPNMRVDINITAFWWSGAWMVAHELGHVLGFYHEHQRWDRDNFVAIRYDNIKAGRAHDYDWIPRAGWITDATPYDYHSIMHYRVCWAGRDEAECRDGHGDSPGAVIDPHGSTFDSVIGQWQDNGISAGDAAKAHAVYGSRRP